ncbi:MAG: hypothetical protein K6E50_00555 [Lachnospiraceae bacterium]|nr:hypothetical protein [Lachnospiraceae bacterium]
MCSSLTTCIIDRERREEREETTKRVTESVTQSVTQNTRVDDILELLSALGPVPADLKNRLLAIKDPDTLKKLIPEAAHATSIDAFQNALYLL